MARSARGEVGLQWPSGAVAQGLNVGSVKSGRARKGPERFVYAVASHPQAAKSHHAPIIPRTAYTLLTIVPERRAAIVAISHAELRRVRHLRCSPSWPERAAE